MCYFRGDFEHSGIAAGLRFREFLMIADTPDSRVTEPCGLGFDALARLTDEEVMLHVQAGHDDALAVLFDRYHRLVLSVGYKILRDLSEAEDLTQSVFLEFYRVAGQYDPARGSTKTWILQYAYHRSINRRRYLLRRDFYCKTDLEQALNLNHGESSLDNGVFSTVEARKMLSGAIQDLTPPQRKTIHMIYFEGMTVREVAEKTGETVTNVRHHYYRGLSRLRKRITSEKGSEGTEPLGRGIVDAET